MSNIWFSADTHFGHKNMIQYCDRPYDSVEEMDLDLIANWNDLVQPEDEVYFLGDFSLDFRRVKQVVPLLNGKIHLVAGNHDLCHSSNNNSRAYALRYIQAGFCDVTENTMLKIAGEEVLCCHMPYFHPADTDRRFPEHKPDNNGGWLLHGHVHQRWQVKGKQVNVGVDVWDYAPVSQTRIEALITQSKFTIPQ